MRVVVVALLIVGSWAAPRPDKTPAAALYGAPAPRDCPLQRVEVATGYGCEESQDCQTEYEEKCSTQSAQECQTTYADQCETLYDDKWETVYNTVYDDKCTVITEKK